MVVLVRDQTFMTPKWKRGGGWSLEICHVFAHKRIVHFLWKS